MVFLQFSQTGTLICRYILQFFTKFLLHLISHLNFLLILPQSQRHPFQLIISHNFNLSNLTAQ